MKESKCDTCKDLRFKVKRQEEYIAQLVEIVAVTNRNATELDRRISQLEHQLNYNHHNLIC
ncbi:hypothetical protein [Pontibacillus marinus]|uniref:Uncharacterized protein n=1 Tax=Pontibacillus marinus BH030004 = DSM 16465 TaxID=1385511 RepID=A0A0A5G6T1_9BACI|nr:hypothetical protein [Pontibacillus marinus]KGX86810.1 hypothetical protein N783_11610 [Pontibacillus marinus BH030004 = DSM 16465]